MSDFPVDVTGYTDSFSVLHFILLEISQELMNLHLYGSNRTKFTDAIASYSPDFKVRRIKGFADLHARFQFSILRITCDDKEVILKIALPFEWV